MKSEQNHPASLCDETLLEQCQLRRERRSGPGGQRRNKVETAVVLIHQPSGLRAEASERRSAEDNRRVALFRLRLELARKIRVAYTDREPSDLWQSRCRGGRISVSSTHTDFPAILAEALDAVANAQFELASAAAQLGCTTSQLRKLIQQDPIAWSHVQEQRVAAGLPRLK
ncbi:MAG: hypothetical protein MI757_05200 [Pirellulales bacterium]|nr:hypothetical protein [Pirellulales bacterium]